MFLPLALFGCLKCGLFYATARLAFVTPRSKARGAPAASRLLLLCLVPDVCSVTVIGYAIPKWSRFSWVPEKNGHTICTLVILVKNCAMLVRMMTMRSVHAGEGYRYLLQSVATNDARDGRADDNRLSDYYAAKGTPPGQWIGSGLACLGAPDTIMGGAEITALQMSALYGEGLHPNADAMIEAGASLDSTRLGSRYPQITDDVPVLEAIKKREDIFLKEHNRLPSEEERSSMAMTVARPFFEKATGFSSPDGRALLAWVNKQKQDVRQAVAGFDFTFSPAKSISLMWALADKDIAKAIAQCHHEAVAETLMWAEENIVRTRRGAGGVEQVKTKGIIASRFIHFDTRAGDPDLHTHVLISNKVMREDGEWRALDGQPLYANQHTLSTRYDRAIMQKLQERLGFGFSARQRGSNKQAVWDVAGISDGLIDVFSKRRAMARPVYERKLNAYVEKHGKQPTDRMAHDLWQQAILETRDAKKPAESLDELRNNWRQELFVSPHGQDYAAEISAVVGRQVQDPRPLFPTIGTPVYDQAVADAAIVCVEELTNRRSIVSNRHIDTAISCHLRGFQFSDSEALEHARTAIFERVLSHEVVQNNAPEALTLPRELVKEDGLAVDKKLGWEQYTTQAIIDAERHVLKAVEQHTAYTCTNGAITDSINRYEAQHGFSLNEGQKTLATHLLTTGTLVATGVGPAGTGKTTSMQIVADVWQRAGHRVIGLAPSAAAADVLGQEIGVASSTIDALTYTWRGLNPNQPGHDPDALPVAITPGDMLLVDEAGMASTKNMAALVEIAEATGAIVRMVGDPYQLDAVENGGLFAALTRFAPTSELEDVMRFNQGRDDEQARASLGVRRGDTRAAGFYADREWLTGGTRENMIHAAVHAYLADAAAGRQSLIIASTNADVDEMNQLIRNERIDTGEVDPHVEVRLARGDVAGLGDTIVTRLNQSTDRGRIMNGELYTVAGIDDQGGIEAVNQKTGWHTYLDPNYVREHTHLGYAATVHRAQGATVDTAHALIDGRCDRAMLYVAVTRGKFENRIYAVTDPILDEEAEDAHFHMAGEKHMPTPIGVVEDVIDRDLRQRSAIETLVDEAEENISPERQHDLYRYGADLAYQAYIAAKLPAVVDMLPPLSDEQHHHLETAARRLLSHGVDPFAMTEGIADGLGDARDVASVVTYRWGDREGRANPTFPPPPQGYCSPELEEWLRAMYDAAPWAKQDTDAETATSADYQAKIQGRALSDLVGLGAINPAAPPTPTTRDTADDKRPRRTTAKRGRRL